MPLTIITTQQTTIQPSLNTQQKQLAKKLAQAKKEYAQGETTVLFSV